MDLYGFICLENPQFFFLNHFRSRNPSPSVPKQTATCLLVNYHLVIENGHRNSGFSHIFPLKMVMFHSYHLVMTNSLPWKDQQHF